MLTYHVKPCPQCDMTCWRLGDSEIPQQQRICCLTCGNTEASPGDVMSLGTFAEDEPWVPRGPAEQQIAVEYQRVVRNAHELGISVAKLITLGKETE